MSHALRHAPSEYALTLSETGHVRLTELASALTVKLGSKITVEQVLEVVAQDSKQRYSVTGSLIRAAQGHSIPVRLGLVATTPPEFLFHGTVWASVTPIMSEGLKPGKRQHVHLSASKETALTVGARHGVPTILTVSALKAHEAGVEFFLSENNVWLVAHLPAKFITAES